MGLDASVMCNCYRSGKTTESPVPRDWLEIDQDGYLALRPEHDADGAYATVYDWMQTCCEHPEMKYASEWIANWTGYRFFQQALARVGWEHYPVLRAHLPESNGGQMQGASAAEALGELRHFRQVGDLGSNVCLVDAASGDVIHKYVAAYGGAFILDGRSGLNAGLDESGFFIQKHGDKSELFRATRFRQTLLDPDRDMHGPEPGRAVFLDLDSGRSFECRTAVSGHPIPWPDGRMQDDRGRCRFAYPAEFHIETRRERPSDYYDILDALERVFRAAVATGNPVRWS